MGSLQKRRNRNNLYYVRYRDERGRQHQISTGTKDRRQAYAFLREIERKVLAAKHGIGEPTEPVRMPVTELFTRYRRYADEHHTRETWRSDFSRHKRLLGFIQFKGIEYVDEISKRLWFDFVDEMLKGRSQKTENNYLMYLKRILNFGVEIEVLDANPLHAVKPRKIVEEYQYFTVEEIKLLVNAAEEPLKSAILILVYTAMRSGELYHLRWEDLDFEKKVIRIWPYQGYSPKGKRPRIIPMHEALIPILESLPRDTEYVLRPYRRTDRFGNQFRQLRRSLGIDKRGLHGLRHSAATYMLANGTDVKTVQMIGGWNDMSSMQRYLHHIENESARNAINGLRFGV